MSPDDIKIKYWFDIASYDLDTAKALLKTQRFLYVGFMCHQAIEKALKGYFTFVLNDAPPYTHNLTLLAEKSGIDKILSETHKNLMDKLAPLNIEARYPTFKEILFKTLSYETCELLIKQTEELYQWISQQLLK